MSTDKEYQVIGFAGCGQLELMAACALFLWKQKKKLLFMDFSETRELRGMIPLPEELEGAKNMVLSYHKIDYVRAGQTMAIEDFGFEYDIILADFGRRLRQPELAACDVVCYITDMRRQNILLLKQRQKSENQRLIIKHFLRGGQAAESIAEELKTEGKDFFVLPYEEKELLLFLSGIPLDCIDFTCLSSATKRLAKQISKEVQGFGSETKHTAKVVGNNSRREVKAFWKGRERAWS